MRPYTDAPHACVPGCGLVPPGQRLSAATRRDDPDSSRHH